MGFASPSASSRKILSVTDTATSGVINYNFTIPQDADTVICKFWTNAQFPGALAGSATVYVQTSEDGGTTWRDVGVWAVTSVITAAQAHFQPFPTSIGYPRGLANWVGSVNASTLVVTSVASTSVGMSSGLPFMGTLGRLSLQYGGTVASNLGINIDVFAPTTNHSN